MWRVFWKGVQISRNTLVIFFPQLSSTSGSTATVTYILHFWLFQANSTTNFLLSEQIDIHWNREKKPAEFMQPYGSDWTCPLCIHMKRKHTKNLFEGGIQTSKPWSSGENAFFLCRLRGSWRNTFRAGPWVVCWTPGCWRCLYPQGLKTSLINLLS